MAAARTDDFEFPVSLEAKVAPSSKTELDVVDVTSSLRSVMWRNVGIERSAERLVETREIIAFWSRYVMDKAFDPAKIGHAAVAGWELQNMLTICHLIATAALTTEVWLIIDNTSRALGLTIDPDAPLPPR